MLADGFKKTFENVTDWEFPLVTLLLSGIDWATILTPEVELEIVNVPRTKPVPISFDCIIAWLDDIIELTIKLVLNVVEPITADKLAEPIVSPTLIKEIAKEPPSEENKEVDISGSLGSWLTLIVKSVKLSQSVLESKTETEGEKGIQETLPVLPPTQLPQLSVKAVPLASPLQSRKEQDIIFDSVWTSTSPNSEFIVEVKVNVLADGFTKISDNKIVWELPLVTLLLSGKEVAITKTPLNWPEESNKFSIVNEP